MHASSGAEARLRASSSEFAAHARRPRARAHAPGGGRAGSRRGIRTRRRMQAGMDASEQAHASEAAPGRQERRPAPRWEPAAPLGTCRRLALRIPIPSIGNPQFWAGVHKPHCPRITIQIQIHGTKPAHRPGQRGSKPQAKAPPSRDTFAMSIRFLCQVMFFVSSHKISSSL